MAVYNPTVAQFVLEGTYLGVQINDIVYADSPAEWDAARLSAVAAVWAQWLSTDIAPLVSDQLIFTGITATSMEGLNSPQVVEVFVTPVAGDRTDPAMPGNVAACISKTSQFRGKSGRGRFYLAGVTEALVSGNTLLQSWVDDVNAACEELQTALVAANARHVIYSTVTAGAPRPIGIAFPVQEFAIRNLRVDSMRSRLP